MADKPIVEERSNGPLVVTNVTRMANQDGSEVAAKPVMALCRCGASENKPFCDGSHAKVGFEDRGGKPEGPDRVFQYAAEDVTVTFNPRLCVHAAECGRLAPNVFNANEKPWIKPENGTLAEVEAVVAACPSGALKVREPQDVGPDLFPDRAEIVVSKNGPYWILDVAPPVPPQGEGMTMRKYALCRCGKSGTKPFCDGSHRAAGWTDGSD